MTESTTRPRLVDDDPTQPDERRQWQVVGALAIVALMLGTLLLWGFSRRASVFLGGPALPVLGQVTDFQLTERSGGNVGLADLRGKVWVADFIFTSCAGPCPRMTERMADLQQRWRKENGLRLVSVSVDPERDTPAVLQKYADRYQANPYRWLFLTGDLEAIKQLAVKGFALGSIEEPIFHSTKFALVDRLGQIRGYYEGTSVEEVNQLSRDIRRVLAERVW
ncbi:MAG: SCO family protein [Phycisphaerae bacterium]